MQALKQLTVKELIKQLSELDGDLLVYAYLTEYDEPEGSQPICQAYVGEAPEGYEDDEVEVVYLTD